MRECPKCHHEKAYFIGDICGDCHAQGADLHQGKPVQKPKARKVPMAAAANNKEGTVVDPLQANYHCQHCERGFRYVTWKDKHESQCPKRPGGSVKAAGKPAPRERAKPGYRRCPHCGKPKSNIWEHKKRCKKNPARRAGAPSARPARNTRGDNNGCLLCRPGPNAALERELVTDAVRAGLSLENAVNFVRRAMGAGQQVKGVEG